MTPDLSRDLHDAPLCEAVGLILRHANPHLSREEARAFARVIFLLARKDEPRVHRAFDAAVEAYHDAAGPPAIRVAYSVVSFVENLGGHVFPVDALSRPTSESVS